MSCIFLSEAHLNCFSKDLLHLADSCTSSETGTWDGTCKDLFPKGTDYPESKEWISAKLVGAWYRVKFLKAFRMSKAIMQQRSWENSQIKDVAIEFDTGPSIQVCSLNLPSLASKDEHLQFSR
ncbi:Hypothetical predicted protein [Paramuricea clavata]|uniref:DUF7402 domain-containing protein n=1 Tax=Paramuricea clavata TaxID=317549 RepID=A0A6S7GBT8_PARCT|nr:Hypothetical predicted protein [Paramuricea clavata]